MKVIEDGHNVCILGSPGTGKSHINGAAVEMLEASGKKVAVTASTGIAASNLSSGRLKAATIHRFTGE